MFLLGLLTEIRFSQFSFFMVYFRHEIPEYFFEIDIRWNWASLYVSGFGAVD